MKAKQKLNIMVTEKCKFKNKGKLRQKLNIMETEKMHALKPTKARTETEHNGD